MLAPVRVTLKQHRAEVGLATLAAVAIGLVGAGVLALASEGTTVAVAAYIVGAMKVLPFALGLVGGIPIVSRELEGRTAQTAWSLFPSRVRWLGRQVTPIAVLLGAAISFPAIVTIALSGHRDATAEQAFQDIGTVGLPAVARAFAAFGIGLFLGALLGRALPALVIGSALALMLFTISTEARTRWLADQGPIVVVNDHATAMQTDWAMLAPDGSQLTLDEAAQRVPGGIEDTTAWLEANGYEWLPLGIARETAMGWIWYEGLIFGAVGTITCLASVPLVNRRRPL